MPPGFKDCFAQDLATDFGTCQGWTVAVPASAENQFLSSDIPMLIMMREFGPVTPYPRGQALSGDLANAPHVHISNGSHGVFGDSRCAREITANRIDEPNDSLDLGCVETYQLLLLDFVTAQGGWPHQKTANTKYVVWLLSV
jgi:hypothetical protein